MENKKIELFVPGRLCLFGEHSDWAGKYRSMNADIVPGFAIVTGIEQGISATVERSDRFSVTSSSPEIAEMWKDFSCEMDSQELKEVAHSPSFFSYCAGVASYMLEWYHVQGVHINITSMTLPMKSGLSSSAAICVLVARAFNQLYQLNLNTMGEMNIAYWGELRTSSRCGRLDQACAFGVNPVLMTFDAEEVEVRSFNIKEPLYWVFSDVGGEKDTIRILSDLNKAYPFPSTEEEQMLHKHLGDINKDITERAMQYMAEGEVEKLGQLMTESMELFDRNVRPLSPVELAAPKLHALLEDKEIRALTWGGKGVGSNGDGSVQFLARTSDAQTKLVSLLQSRGLQAYPLTIRPKHAIRKAIIPVAGFGTRLYPATRAVRKEFFPIVDRDGLVKPVILILLEELLESGIEDICLILGSEEERRQYSDFFERQLSDEHISKLSRENLNYERHILEVGKHLHYVYQTEKRGFGDAVYHAASFVAGEPVLLLLGDTIYRSNTNKPCALQLIEAYERYPQPIISLGEVPLNRVSYFGILSGTWSEKSNRIMQISAISEKPSVSEAEEHLGVRDINGEKRYYGVFGQYVLTPDVFEQLAENIKNNLTNAKGEIELTTALEQIRHKRDMLGIRLDGESYDMGNPQALCQAMQAFSAK